MPDTPLSLLAAYLWDLRAQCERQLRCLTSAQRVIDDQRERREPSRRTGVPGELREYITEVESIHATIGVTIADVSRELATLESGGVGEG
jgi:hypothetical protein